MIKDIINKRKEFLEASDLLLEDDTLDDTIVLSEGPDEPEDDEEPEKKDDDKENDDDEGEESAPAGATPEHDPGDLADEPIDEPMNLPGDDTLPEPIGKQTGEPAEIGASDILSMEINLATNTSTDTLPIPPAGASDAVEDNGDLLSQRIDSGFGGESEDKDDLLNEPLDDNVQSERENEDDLLSEAITLDDDTSSSDNDSADAPTEDVPDNPVTMAVKDKVGELKSDAETITDEPAASGNVEDALKKLTNLTKGLEDVKAMLLNKQ